jgi:hypothetical protein
VRLTDFTGIADRTAKKLGERTDLIEDLLTAPDGMGDDVGADDLELADFVADAVSSQYHDNVLEKASELAIDAFERRDAGEADRVRSMEDWTRIR